MQIKKYQNAGTLPMNPAVIKDGLIRLRTKIANTKVGQRLAQELGIKPKQITLSDGTKTTVTGELGALGLLLGGSNPSKTVGETTKVITRSYPILEKYLGSNGLKWGIIHKEILDGQKDAVNYLYSDVKKTLDKHNIELAERLFKEKIKPYKSPGKRA